MNQAMAVIGGGMSKDAVNYIQNSHNEFLSIATPLGNHISFGNNLEKMQQLRAEVTSNAFLNKVGYLGNIVNATLQVDNIKPLTTLEELNLAPPVMQRWIMANPNIREMYHDELISGYSETYVDERPNCIGNDHYEYRRVMDGIAHIENDRLVTTCYMEMIAPEDNLTFDEQIAILTTWKAANVIIDSGIDFTDV